MEKNLVSIYRKENILPIIIGGVVIFVSGAFSGYGNLIVFLAGLFGMISVSQIKIEELNEGILEKLPIGKEIILKKSLKVQVNILSIGCLIYLFASLVVLRRLDILNLLAGIIFGASVILSEEKWRLATNWGFIVLVVLSTFLMNDVILAIIIKVIIVTIGSVVIIKNKEKLQKVYK